MATWTLEKAKNGFSELVRRALNHEPQVVTRGRAGEDAVVVISRSDYIKLIAPTNLADFLKESPLAASIAAGDFDAPSLRAPFARPRDMGREIDLG